MGACAHPLSRPARHVSSDPSRASTIAVRNSLCRSHACDCGHSYDVDGFAATLGRALDMGPQERGLRMRAMRRIVAGRNVFSWASDILEGLESLWTKPLRYAARAPEDAPV
jgi:hypothetical protein